MDARTHAPGERIGPFELARPIGAGGMGEVWLARQADGRIAREVAIKLASPRHQAGAWRERFRRERDILARLEHPHIARLYDAGVTEAGQPWLAMEFVAGPSLSDYLAAHPLPTPGRLALFRQVLAAVAHAHRHLVVHRDLKPANILVDASGQVRLLDFGVAKLLDSEGAGEAADITRITGNAMTLRYAAPEQRDGGAITTATDTYALGVILREMLAGPTPYDLDAIVLKATRPDPADRYASVDLLDEDVLAYLERRPVAARAGTWRYLAGRFAARHKLPLAMAAAGLVTLLAGFVVADRERRVAVAEKARAERHFAGVRKLANTFIFDVHGELERLAGSLKARKALVGTALEYLDRLAAESSTDPVLALEVAAAYRKLAEISGDSRGAHLGDPAGARRNAVRASELLAAIEARDPDNAAALREHRVVALLLGRLKLEAGDSSGVEDTARAAHVAEHAAGLPGAAVADRRDLGATLAEYGGILAVVKDDHAQAAVQLARATSELEALVRENPGDVATLASLAYAYERAAIAAEATGSATELPRAIAMMEKSVLASQSVVRDDPARVSHAQTLVKRYNNAARMRLRVGDVARAREKAESARLLVEGLVAADPRNVGNATMLAGVLAMASGIEHRGGRHARAIELARASIEADARLPAEVRAGLIVRENAVGAMRSLGASACALRPDGSQPRSRHAALLKEAHALLEESRAFKRELVQRGIDAREAANAIDEIEADLRRCEAAIALLG